MKQYYLIILICILVVVLVFSSTLPFVRVSSLCTAIRNNDTGAIERHIRVLENVNQPSFPMALRWFANMVSADADIPLIVACAEGNSKAVELLLEEGADPNFFLVDNWSAIEAAFANNHLARLEIAKALIDAGANVDLCGSGTSALFLELQHFIYKKELSGVEYAVFEECVTLLLDNGASRCDKQENTYLHYLARKDDSVLMKKLISNYPVDINCQNINGKTALMWAAENGATAAVDFLVCLGADISLLDNEGKSAYDYALENNQEHVVCYFQLGK